MGRDECIEHAPLCAFQSDALAYSRPHLTKRNTPPVTQRFTFHTRTTANFKLHTWHDNALYRPPKAQQQVNIG